MQPAKYTLIDRLQTRVPPADSATQSDDATTDVSSGMIICSLELRRMRVRKKLGEYHYRQSAAGGGGSAHRGAAGRPTAPAATATTSTATAQRPHSAVLASTAGLRTGAPILFALASGTCRHLECRLSQQVAQSTSQRSCRPE